MVIGCAYIYIYFFGRHKIAFYSNSLTLVAALYYFIKYQLANAFKRNSFF